MKTFKIFFFLLSLGISLSCARNSSVNPSPVNPIDSLVIGNWKLVRIINGFSQVNQTPGDTGFSQTLEYKSDGTYQRITINTNGQQTEKGSFYTGPNPTKTSQTQAILYPDDKTTQPYSFQEGHLFLYQRGSQSATLADGSTYEYQR